MHTQRPSIAVQLAQRALQEPLRKNERKVPQPHAALTISSPEELPRPRYFCASASTLVLSDFDSKRANARIMPIQRSIMTTPTRT